MRNPEVHPPLFDQTAISKWERYRELWANWREPIAGLCIALGLCWPFLLPSLAHVPWWTALPVAMLGGLLRQRNEPKSRMALLPLWSVIFVFLLFVLYAVSFHPLSPYGNAKTLAFLFGVCTAYVAARKQAPLTPELLRGMRWGLLVSLAASAVLLYTTRDLYLKQQEFGIAALNNAVSLTAFPLVIAMSIMGLLPRRVSPFAVFAAGALCLGGAVLEVFVRSRFHAIVLCLLAVIMVLGPPWKHIFWRVMASCLLVIIGIGVCVNVLPLMGDSFEYLTWANPENLAGRGPIWELAVQGFWAHPLGQGIGSFETADFFFSYPHNIILEAAFELGILGLLAMLAMYAAVLRRVAQLWVSPPHRLLAVITILVFAHVLKSGDISTIAFHYVFLYLLVVATPLAPSWPLVRGREVT